MRFTLEHIGLTLPEGVFTSTTDFYERVLGLARLPQSDPSAGSVWLSDGRVALELRASIETDGTPLRRPSHLAFSVGPDDFDSAQKELAALGVDVEPVRPLAAGGWTTFFEDPAGNLCQLVGRTAPLDAARPSG